MAENIENLEFQEISEISVTEQKNGFIAIGVDSNGEAKAYPLDNFKTGDEVENDLTHIRNDVGIVKASKAEKLELNAVKAEIADLQSSKLDKSALGGVQTAIKRYKPDVANISNLPTSGNEEGDGRKVINDKDTSGNSYIWVWDGNAWSRTVFTTLPTNVALKEDDKGDKVVYGNAGKPYLQNYDLNGFGGSNWLTNSNLGTTDSSYYSYDNYVINGYLPTICIRVKNNNAQITITGTLLIAKVVENGNKFTLSVMNQVDFSEISNEKGEVFIFPNINYSDTYTGCHIFIKVNANKMLYNNLVPFSNLYSIRNVTSEGNIAKNYNILFSFITISKENSIIPLQKSVRNLEQYDGSLKELQTFEPSGIFTDNFDINTGWQPEASYPLNNFDIANGLFTLNFTASTSQAVINKPQNNQITVDKYYDIEIKLRRKTNNGGGLDIGCSFGSLVSDGSAGYKTIPATDITTEFKVFNFSFKMLAAKQILIGTHQSRNKGDQFEIDYIKVLGIETQMMREVLALKSAVVSPVIGNLQEYINNNRVINLPAGVFEISSPLSIPNNTKISGVRGGTILKLTGTATSIINLDGNSQDITLNNLTFEGKAPVAKTIQTSESIKKRTGVGVDCGVYANGYAKNIHISNCEFKNFSMAGVRMLQTHTGTYNRTFKITDCVFNTSYYGLLSDIRSEYHTVMGCTFAYNQIGCFIAGGNNFMGTCHFDANSVGCVISGTGGENDSHGSITGSSFNHNLSYSLAIIDISNGFTFTGCHCFQGDILIDNAKGLVFIGGEIACGIKQLNSNTAVNMIHSTLFIKSYNGGTITDASKLDLKNNRYMDGSDSTTINN